jgi:signal peptidase I
MRTELPLSGRLGLFEEVLAHGADLRVRVTGRSMVPFLRGGEVVVVRKVACSSLRRGDIIFFRDREGFPVVHRIVGRERRGHQDGGFRTKGDALCLPDEPVREGDILGMVCAVESDHAFRNLETVSWRGANYLLALFSLFSSRLSVAVTTVRHALRRAVLHPPGRG